VSHDQLVLLEKYHFDKISNTWTYLEQEKQNQISKTVLIINDKNQQKYIFRKKHIKRVTVAVLIRNTGGSGLIIKFKNSSKAPSHNIIL